MKYKVLIDGKQVGTIEGDNEDYAMEDHIEIEELNRTQKEK